MNNGKVDWRGSFVAVVTPFTERGAIDERAFGDNVRRMVDEGVDGIVVSGCTGESWSLSPDERVLLCRLALDAVGGRVPVIAGTGGVPTPSVIELSHRAKEAGVAGVMILPPYYAMPGPREVVEHYRAIADAVKHPILLYNIPRRTGINLTTELLDQIVEFEWVVAIKESSNDFIQTEKTILEFGDRISVFTGHSAERGVPAILMGAKGFVSSTESQIMGRPAVEMYALVQRGELDRARATQMKTLALDDQMRKIGTFPANLKAAMNLLGRNGGAPRPPLLPLLPADIERLRVVLDRLQLMPAHV
ncbi:MAG: 4-hydroxy-tetrahydrodipicolinate synthase [Acidobacteria bacterium]|nr:4-hydroxy-tetrahydrodipicolinate synthase [Acidobacteriota bacterium]